MKKSTTILDWKNATIVLLFLTAEVIILCWAFNNIGYRHKETNGKIYKAIHVYLPGYIEVGKPADTIYLSKWSGTKFEDPSLSIPFDGSIDSVRCKELNAELVLRAIGWVDSTYTLKKIGEHFVLISPEKSWKEWSWTAHYRLGSWKFDEENN